MSGRSALSSPRVHLVTGASGFVGAALVLELLRRTQDHVVAVLRPGDQGASRRIVQALSEAAKAYGTTLHDDDLARCRGVAGDLLRPGCAVDAKDVGPVDHVWHCAASLRYEDRFRDEIRATNVQGTARALALARRLGAARFDHVSTAYVSGRRTGHIDEAPADGHANNQYEQSKIDGERLVLDADRLQTRIFRPSVVVGHSRTLAATTFSGFYGFVRQLAQFKGMIDRTQRGLLERTALRVRLDAHARINLVPVDAVASELARIGLSEAPAGVFHLTHPVGTPVGMCVETIFAMLDLHPPQFVEDRDAFEWLDARFDERLDFFGSYIRGDKHFARDRTDAALDGPSDPPPAYDAPAVDALGRWYLDVLSEQRRALPVAR